MNRQIILIVGLFCAAFSIACACNCGFVPPQLEFIDRGYSVFNGVVVSTRPIAGANARSVVFRIEKLWRGSLGSTVTIKEPDGIFQCVHYGRFRTGERYLVYVGNDLQMRMCTNTRRLANGEDYPKEFEEFSPNNRPQKPVENTRPVAPADAATNGPHL